MHHASCLIAKRKGNRHLVFETSSRPRHQKRDCHRPIQIPSPRNPSQAWNRLWRCDLQYAFQKRKTGRHQPQRQNAFLHQCEIAWMTQARPRRIAQNQNVVCTLFPENSMPVSGEKILPAKPDSQIRQTPACCINIVMIDFVTFVTANTTPFALRCAKKCAKTDCRLNNKIRSTKQFSNQGDHIRR